MKEKERLAALEAESDRVLEYLFENPSDEKLIRRLNEIDVQILQLTGEKALDCITF